MNTSIFNGLVVLGILGLFCGCSNCAVSYRGVPKEQTTVKGFYIPRTVSVTTKDGSSDNMRALKLVDAMVAGSDNRGAFRPNPKEQSVPVDIKVNVETTNTRGVLGTLNNVLSVFTLTIWPFYSSSDVVYGIHVDYPTERRDTRMTLEYRALSSCFLLGYVPVPAWADERVSTGTRSVRLDLESEPLLRAVESVFTESDYRRELAARKVR